MSGQPFETWKDALYLLEKRIARVKPAAVGRFALWFAPMPLESIQQRGDQIRLRFACSSLKRKQEVLALQPVIEALLAAEFFTGQTVKVELIEQYNPPPGAAGSLESSGGGQTAGLNGGQTAHNSPAEAGSAPFTAPPPAPAVPDDGAGQAAEPASAPPVNPVSKTLASSRLAYYRQKAALAAGSEIGDEDLQAVLQALEARRPQALAATEADAKSADSTLLLDPAYATTYDEIVRAHSAVYLPAYFTRHLRHMGAADGLRYMALRQVAYINGLRNAGGTHLLPATVKELCRWSTLQPRRIFGGLEDPSSYLFLLAGKAPYLDYYAARPAASRWEDEAGFHWKSAGREFCVWKRNGQPSNECSQLLPDRVTGELQWRQAPLIYRVQLSMPLCPEDEQALRAALLAFGVRDDPLGAIQRCLALPRAELIPDRPARLSAVPRRLYTVQELVMDCWNRPAGQELAARVAVQSKLLETHLLQPERDLLKIPFYLLEKWGPYLSPAQLWTAILAMDRVYAGAGDGAYRDTTILRNGIKEMTLWTEDEYSKGAARKISKWLYPFNVATGEAGQKEADSSEHFNPWFSVFVSEVLPENGARVKNADNSVQMKLRVLPLVPLCPEDTLRFARKMGLERLAVRDAAGQVWALEITEEELAVYIPAGGALRTLRYSHTGELRYGQASGQALPPLRTRDRQLGGIELLAGEQLFAANQWPGALFGSLENQAGALSGMLENRPGALCGVLENGSDALFGRLENGPGVLSGRLEKPSGALFGELALDPGALFGLLLKLLILNLYGIKQSSLAEKAPSEKLQPEDADSLEQFGSRQGQFIQWAGVSGEADWALGSLVKSMGIADGKSLAERGVTALALVACALELFATPAERFTSGRVAVLVSRLRNHPRPEPGIYLRIAEQGPLALQDCLQRAILGVSPLLNDPDWDQAMGRAKRDDLIELAERLGLARVLNGTK